MPGTLDSPFSAGSVWNTPIGDGAQYVAANIPRPDYIVEEECIIVIGTTGDPLRDVHTNDQAWVLDGDRCAEDTDSGIDVHIPDSFVVDDPPSTLPNNCAAIFEPQFGDSVIEFQPFQRCTAGGDVTFGDGQTVFEYNPFTSDGRTEGGSRGGSTLPALGGTIRIGEGLTTGGYIPHPLAVLLNKLAMSADGDGFRFPANSADTGFETLYEGTVAACQMGSLLALLPDFDVDQLTTEAAKIIARTLIYYGAYVVDLRNDEESLGLSMEWGPAGRWTEDFTAEWSMAFGQDTDVASIDPFGADMGIIFDALHVVDNNSSSTIGGGGTPLLEISPPGGGGGAVSWRLGSHTFAAADVPSGVLSGGGGMRWKHQNPIGYSGTVMQYVLTEGAEHRLHLMVSEAEYLALKAIADAHAPVTFTAPRPRFAGGVTVVIEDFAAQWNDNVRGDSSHPDYWWEIDIILVETGA